MNHIAFFKLQAKNLKKDFATRHKVHDDAIGADLYSFNPKYFDVENIEVTYDFSEKEIEGFSLMKSQHFIAQLVGFRKWSDLINASEEQLELAKLLFDNQHKLSVDDWKDYIFECEKVNNCIFSDVERLDVFKKVFLVDGNFATVPNDFRLNFTTGKEALL